MNHNLRYPIEHCHYCNSIMMYSRYDNGTGYAYCNAPTQSGCMSLTYLICDNKINVREFTVSDNNWSVTYKYNAPHVCCMPISAERWYQTSAIAIEVNALLETIDPNIILDKAKSLHLLHDIRRIVQ